MATYYLKHQEKGKYDRKRDKAALPETVRSRRDSFYGQWHLEFCLEPANVEKPSKPAKRLGLFSS
jgi:hypothetical protein